MAETTSTIVVYPLNGSNRRFTIPYEYLARRFISATLMGKVGVQHKPLKMNSDFRFVTLNTIETTKAWGIQDGYETIEIRRETSATDRLVEFADGSVLRSRDLNVSAIQTIHIAEEARNLAATTLTTNDDGNLDARGRKIVNLAPATEDLDAVNFGQVKQWSGSALNQADRAEREANRSRDEANKSAASAVQAKASENAAKASQTAAKASQGAAKDSQTAAKASQDAAKVSENNAKASENAAKASQTAAKASQDAAKVSETNAKTSETVAKNAQAQAQKIADSVNENTDISKDQAEKAAKSATESAQSASASASSANKASKSEAAAALSASSANLLANKALDSAIAAEASQVAAEQSETVAVEKAAEATSAAETARGFSDAAASSVEAVHEHVNKAKDWAENPVNEPVEGNMYSAKHWASVAQGNVNGDNYLTKSGNLEEIVNKEEARKNLGVPEEVVKGIADRDIMDLNEAATWDTRSPSYIRRLGNTRYGYLFPHNSSSNYGSILHTSATGNVYNLYFNTRVGGVNTQHEVATTYNTLLLGTTPLAARKSLQLDPLVPMGGGKLSYQSHELANQQDIESVENKITLLNDAKADNTKVDEAVESINVVVNKKADKTALDSSVKSLNEAIAKKADTVTLNSNVSTLNAAIAKKADQTALNSTNAEVAKKVDNSTYTEGMAGKVNTSEIGLALGKIKRYGDDPMPASTVDNMNTFNRNGVIYAASREVINRPPWPEFSAVKWINMGVTNSWESQLALGAYANTMALRARKSTAGDWLPWARIYTHLDHASYVDVEIRSDKRDKSNLETLKNPLDSIEKLTGYTYLLDTQDGPKESAGVIAQDVLKVLPTAVGTSTNHNEEERYTVNYNSLTALLIEAVKELSAEVKHLKEVINNGSN